MFVFERIFNAYNCFYYKCWYLNWLIFGVLMPLSTIFQLYYGDSF